MSSPFQVPFLLFLPFWDHVLPSVKTLVVFGNGRKLPGRISFSFCPLASSYSNCKHISWGGRSSVKPHILAGTKRVKYLEENVAAYFIKLSKEEVNELSNIFHPQAVSPHWDLGWSVTCFTGIELSRWWAVECLVSLNSSQVAQYTNMQRTPTLQYLTLQMQSVVLETTWDCFCAILYSNAGAWRESSRSAS